MKERFPRVGAAAGLVSDDEYLRRYEAEVASDVEQWRGGAHGAEWTLAVPLHWVRVKDDAHGGRGGAWVGYARLVRERFGLQLRAMQPDGSWRPWSPRDLDPDER